MGSSIGPLRLGGISPKLIYLPKTDKINNDTGIRRTKGNTGGLYKGSSKKQKKNKKK